MVKGDSPFVVWSRDRLWHIWRSEIPEVYETVLERKPIQPTKIVIFAEIIGKN